MFTRPDNGVYPSNALSSDIDIAELAARLSIIRLRRSGRVIFYDDFATGLAWFIPGIAATGIYSISPVGNVRPYTPPGLLYLIGTAGNYATTLTNLPMIAVSMLGIEVTMTFGNNQLPNLADYFEIFYTGNLMQSGIRWNTTAHQWEYWSSGGTWTVISGLPAPTSLVNNEWGNIKVVLDIANKRYETLYYNRDIYSLSLAAQSTANLGAQLSLSVIDASGSTAGVMIDNVIVTTDERT